MKRVIKIVGTGENGRRVEIKATLTAKPVPGIGEISFNPPDMERAVANLADDLMSAAANIPKYNLNLCELKVKARKQG